MKFRDTQGLIYSIKIIDLDSPYREKDVIDCRLYSAHSSHVVHCALWVCDPSMGCYGSGVGKAGGYGYHKGSAAIEAALRDLGLSDFRSFAGGGYEKHKPHRGVAALAVRRLNMLLCNIFNA
jgi:hypothetical protein